MLQYMEEVDNGMVTGLAYNSDLEEGSREVLEEVAYDAEEFLETALRDHPEHDYEQTEFENPAVNVEAVRIDTDLGIVDVFRDGSLSERYTILGVLEEEDDLGVYLGQDMAGSTQVIRQSDNSIDWNQEKAAAYEAVENYVDISPGEMKDDPEVVEGLTDRSVPKQRYNEASARSHVKNLDTALARTSDERVNGIADFEELGEVKMDHEDHPFSTGKSGPKGLDAANQIVGFFKDLYQMHLIDYELGPVVGDTRAPKLEIRDEHFDDGVDDDLAAVSDYGEDVDEFVEELVDDRYPW
jgi:hypothetical protein